MRVFIVRHGETDWNVEHKFQGEVDVPLNQNGLDQAQRIASRLRLEHFDVIYSSPLSRALETGKSIAKYHPRAPFLIEHELREVSFGSWEGKTWADIEQELGGMRHLSPHEEFIDRIHGGNSLEQRVEKLIPVVEQWLKTYKNKTILLSTHGYIKKGILIAFKVATYDSEFQSQRFENTALTIIRPFDEEKIELLADTSHLL